jgi:hypothetical protein
MVSIQICEDTALFLNMEGLEIQTNEDSIKQLLFDAMDTTDRDFTSRQWVKRMQLVQIAVRMFKLGYTMDDFERIVQEVTAFIDQKIMMMRMDRLDYMMMPVRCVWMIEHSQEEKMTAIQVDLKKSSSFYQALFYHLLWKSREVEMMEDPSLAKLKDLIFENSIQTSDSLMHGREQDMQDLKEKYKMKREISFAQANKSLGIWGPNPNIKPDNIALELSAAAFDVQIIIYVADPDFQGSANILFSSGGRDQCVHVFNGRDPIFLLCRYGEQYEILCEPAKGIMQTSAGETIPDNIIYSNYYLQERGGPEHQMPMLSKCMRCRKLIR